MMYQNNCEGLLAVILGATKITLENLNYTESDVEEVLYEMLHGTFASYSVEDCQSAVEVDVNVVMPMARRYCEAVEAFLAKSEVAEKI